METLTYGSGRASGCDSPGPLNWDIFRWIRLEPRCHSVDVNRFHSKSALPRRVDMWVSVVPISFRAAADSHQDGEMGPRLTSI